MAATKPASTTTTTKPDSESTPAAAGNESAVDNTRQHGDHDRVAMLSLKADGTPDQLNPEFIVPRADALAATIEQFAQQATASLTRPTTGAVTIVGKPGDEPDEIVPAHTGEDPAVDARRAELDEAVEVATANAEATVDALLPVEDKETR